MLSLVAVSQSFVVVMAKFCANLSFMFTEVPFLSRYKAAKEAGFQCVESGFPFGIPLEQVTTAKNDANISQVLVNTFTGEPFCFGALLKIKMCGMVYGWFISS